MRGETGRAGATLPRCAFRRAATRRRRTTSANDAATGAAPIACTPPSTCRISPVIARASGESRNRQASATGVGSARSQPSGAWRSQISARPSKPSMLEAATVCSGPAATRLERTPARAEVARQVAVDRLQRRLGDAGPVVGRPRHAGVEVQADDARRLAALEQRQQRRRQRLHRERARLEGGDRRGARGAQELAAERVGGDEGDGVQHAVEAPPALVEGRRRRPRAPPGR